MSHAFSRLLVAALMSVLLAVPAYATYEMSSVNFNWVSSAGHTPISTWAAGQGCPDVAGDDSVSAPLDIGFSFRFGATAYTQVRVNTNGRVQFNNTFCGYGTQAVGPPRTYTNPIANANLNNVMRIYGADLDVTAAGTITYAAMGTAPSRVFIVTWNNVSQWREGGANNRGNGTSYNLQVQLHESGDFYFVYGVSDNVTEPTNQAMGPAQIAWQLSTTNFVVVQSGLPANNSSFRFRRIGPDAEYRMDESPWTGAVGDVIDSSINAQAGRSYGGVNTAFATPARPGSPGTCRYGQFDGINDYVEILDGPALNGSDVLTYTAWIRPSSWTNIQQVMAKSVHGGGSGRAQMGMFSESGVFKGRAESLAGRYEVQTALPATNHWTHVGLVFSGTALTLYINGAAASSTAFAATTLVQTTDPLAISKRVGSAEYFFTGGIDEVRLYRSALSPVQMAGVMAETRPCSTPPGAARFRLSHAGYGIHCRTEPIAMMVLDGVNGLVGSYSGLVSMTTQSGRGTWSLAAGNGTLVDATPNDGLATYQFVPADGGQVTFALSYPEGSSPLDVEVFQNSDPTIRDDDTEALLAFAPSGFTITGNALPNPPPGSINDPIATQTAGTNFALHVAAFGQTANDPVCGVIESYTGAKSLSWWMNYVDPTSGFLTATVNSVAVGASEPAAVLQSITFTQGQAAVTVKYKDVGSIRMQVKDAAAQPQVIRGNSNAFVVRPATLTVSRVETLAGAANPGATTATGPAFVASGTAFRVEVDVLDAEGSRTANYGREIAPEGLNVASSTLVVPAGGRNGSSGTGVLGGGSAFVATATAGRFRNDSVSFDEVGIVRLAASVADGSYLGTGPLTGAQSGNAGRFRPASFALVPGATVTAGCGTFTYMAQPALGVNYVVEAHNALAARTWNYDAGLLGAGAVATVTAVAENANAGTDFGARLSNVVGVWTLGRSATSTASASLARLVAPDGPYDSMQVGLRVNDPIDGVVLSSRNLLASAPGDCLAAGTCDAVAIGAPTRLRYGRLMVKPAFGPETQVLAVPLEAQYFDGVFQPNTADNCTTYAIAQGVLGSYSGNLIAGATALITPVAATALVSGGSNPNARLTLSAPGIGRDGSVNVTLDVPTHLEFDWTGAGLVDPVGTAWFGRYRGHDRIIFWRER